MKKLALAACVSAAAVWATVLIPEHLIAQSAPADPLVEGYRQIEVASVADAMEQLYGQRNHMTHEMRPHTPTKFAGRAVTVSLRKEEHKEGAKALQGMLDAIDSHGAGSVYVMVVEDGKDIGGIGGLMATTMKARGFAGAVIDGGLRDVAQVQKLQFPVFSRSIVPSTSVNHYRFAGANIPVNCGGVRVAAGDIIVADLDGVAVVPRQQAQAVLAKAQELENTEHSMYPFIAKYRSLKEAVARFGRI